jgi:hypothetical protein
MAYRVTDDPQFISDSNAFVFTGGNKKIWKPTDVSKAVYQSYLVTMGP